MFFSRSVRLDLHWFAGCKSAASQCKSQSRSLQNRRKLQEIVRNRRTYQEMAGKAGKRDNLRKRTSQMQQNHIQLSKLCVFRPMAPLVGGSIHRLRGYEKFYFKAKWPLFPTGQERGNRLNRDRGLVTDSIQGSKVHERQYVTLGPNFFSCNKMTLTRRTRHLNNF